MGDTEFWEVVSHFPSKILCYNTSTVWEASEPPPFCHHHDTLKLRFNGAFSNLMKFRMSLFSAGAIDFRAP